VRRGLDGLAGHNHDLRAFLQQRTGSESTLIIVPQTAVIVPVEKLNDDYPLKKRTGFRNKRRYLVAGPYGDAYYIELDDFTPSGNRMMTIKRESSKAARE
jgi:hypothetical protein